MIREYGFSLCDLFDRFRGLRDFNELAPEMQAQIKTFEVRRTRTRRDGETIITEELIRVVLRDGRVAKIADRGGSTLSEKAVSLQPLVRRVVTRVERNAGVGRTEAAASIVGPQPINPDDPQS